MRALILFSLITLSFGLLGQDEKLVVVEESAQFEGGMANFYKFLMKNIHYPKEAKRKRAEGKVYVRFFITETGDIDKDSIDVVEKQEIANFFGERAASEVTADESLAQEAIRLIMISPRWIPGKRRGVAVRQKFTIPIQFKL